MVTRTIKQAHLLCVLLCCGCAVFLCGATDDPVPAGSVVYRGEEAAHYLGVAAAEHQANLSQIQTLKYTMVLSSSYADPGPFSYLYVYTQKGPWLRILQWKRPGLDESPDIPAKPCDRCMTVNDEYIAQSYEVGSFAYIREHNSVDDISPAGLSAIEVYTWRGPRLYGFGNGIDSVEAMHRSAIARDDIAYEVRLAQEEGQASCTVSCFRVRDNHLLFEVMMDPARRFLVTRSRTYDPAGALSTEATVKSGEIAPGVWFPVEWTVVDYMCDEGKQDSPYEEGRTHNVIHNAEVNTEVEDDLFVWTSLPIRADVHKVLRTDVSGQTERMRIIDGELVPEIIAAQHGL